MTDIFSTLSDKLDFSEIDLTPADEVITQILSELPNITHDIVLGKVKPYSGNVESYHYYTDTSALAALAKQLNNVKEERFYNIQQDLGKQGEEFKTFECFLYTPEYTNYKYRLFFMRYGIAKYPVQFTIEESIANTSSVLNSKNIHYCNTREDVEKLSQQSWHRKRWSVLFKS